MANDVIISYNGDTVLSLSDSGIRVLETYGKFCVDDITIEYSRATYSGEHHSVALISFKIDYQGTITTYGAVNGATWSEWVNSEYNTDGFYVDNNTGGIYAASGGHVDKTLDNPVDPAETIINNQKYYLEHSPL